MTTPNGTPSEAKALQYRQDAAGDAAVQAAAAKSEAKVRGTDQDRTQTGDADVAAGLAALKSNVTNAPGQPFTGNP